MKNYLLVAFLLVGGMFQQGYARTIAMQEVKAGAPKPMAQNLLTQRQEAQRKYDAFVKRLESDLNDWAREQEGTVGFDRRLNAKRHELELTKRRERSRFFKHVVVKPVVASKPTVVKPVVAPKPEPVAEISDKMVKDFNEKFTPLKGKWRGFSSKMRRKGLKKKLLFTWKKIRNIENQLMKVEGQPAGGFNPPQQIVQQSLVDHQKREAERKYKAIVGRLDSNFEDWAREQEGSAGFDIRLEEQRRKLKQAKRRERARLFAQIQKPVMQKIRRPQNLKKQRLWKRLAKLEKKHYHITVKLNTQASTLHRTDQQMAQSAAFKKFLRALKSKNPKANYARQIKRYRSKRRAASMRSRRTRSASWSKVLASRRKISSIQRELKRMGGQSQAGQRRYDAFVRRLERDLHDWGREQERRIESKPPHLRPHLHRLFAQRLEKKRDKLERKKRRERSRFFGKGNKRLWKRLAALENRYHRMVQNAGNKKVQKLKVLSAKMKAFIQFVNEAKNKKIKQAYTKQMKQMKMLNQMIDHWTKRGV